ncbi:hypothetical protein FP435_03465 [Lactobacillus sp. PV037]|uniref:hypothetical protein n=1 Tax=unclassified Lactobacillus TaxID=2620435 RepID=UPI0022400363|nr:MULTISPECIES: hypothetical protein [unclassified Lactobacillus]QNQ82321.1 hypothetical protein FP433_04365 [Lactobacillus sp. PV012]QNQ83567.1 hypothetical protein FP435_03465 [Lactobacillus sp. PV037]
MEDNNLKAPSSFSKGRRTNHNKIILITGGIIVAILVIIGIHLHNSPKYNPNSPFYKENITFGYYKYKRVTYNTEDGTFTKAPVKRVSIESTVSIVNNIFSIMYKNGDGKSESYKYFKSHPKLLQNVAATSGFFNHVNLGKRYRDVSEEVVYEYQDWLGLVEKDKKAAQVWKDWQAWMDSCIPEKNYNYATENIFTGSKYYVTYSPTTQELINGEKVEVMLDGDTKLLSKYNVDLTPIKVKVSGFPTTPEEVDD